MKINSNVIELYKKICPKSTSKCETKEDIIFKIHRAITLGMVVDIRSGGNKLIVRYYDLEFHINKNKIVHMKKDSKKGKIFVDERVKEQYNKSVQYIVNW